jgi:hypothetical protein
MTSPESWSDWLGVVGSVASLASFGAAGYAALKTRQIGRSILFNARSGEIASRIARFSAFINQGVKEFPGNRHELEVQLRLCLATLYRVEASLPNATLRNMKIIRDFEKRYFGSTWSDAPDDIQDRKNWIWRFHCEIEIVLMHIQEQAADRRLGGSDENC